VTVRVAGISSRADRRAFRDLPGRLYGGDPAFVPMLDMTHNALLDRRRNPFWRHAEGQEWLAWRGTEPVGRVGACVDRELQACAPGCGVVGLLDCADDAEVAAALFATAEAWLRARGCSRARGPLNYSIHDTAGLLVEGFDKPPAIDTTWNPCWIPPLWEASGWQGVQDLLGCAGDVVPEGPERAWRFAERARRQGVHVRPVDFGRFDEEVELLRQVYNEAWKDNWGHVPATREEFAFKAKDLKSVVDPDLLRVAEVEGRPVGILIGIPDLNVAIRRCGGHLLPWGWWHLLRARRLGGRCRIMALGVMPGFRIRGVEAALLCDSYAGFRDRYRWCEASWVLADNAPMRNGLALHNLFPYKRWRLYEKDLPG